jgi:hypothetical protein
LNPSLQTVYVRLENAAFTSNSYLLPQVDAKPTFLIKYYPFEYQLYNIADLAGVSDFSILN